MEDVLTDDMLLSDISSKIDDIISDDVLGKMIMNNKDNNHRTKPIKISSLTDKEEMYSTQSCSFSPSSLTKHNHWFHESSKYGSSDKLFDDNNIDDDEKDDDHINTPNYNKVSTNNNENRDIVKRGSFTATKSTLKEKIKTKYEDIIFDNDLATNDNDIFSSNNGGIFSNTNSITYEQNENDIVKLLLGESNYGSSDVYTLSEQVLVASNYTSTQRNKDMVTHLQHKSSIASTEQLFSSHLENIIDQESDNSTSNENNEVKDRLFTEPVATSSSSSSPPLSKTRESFQESDDASYQNFLDHLGSPQCSDIALSMRKFLNSVLGPYGDGVTPPSPQHGADYIFYGTRKLEERCRHYFDDMEHVIENHKVFKDASDERILSIRDCIERYIFNRIADIAFQSIKVPDDDEIIIKKMKILSFLTPDVLDIKTELRNDMIWALARDELKKINSCRTPGEKINCIVKSAGVIMRYLSLEAAKSKECVGADDFLPLFIYVVLHCHIPKLASNCAYIQSFYNPGRLRSKQGYYFVNLQSAIEFVLNVEADMISIDPEFFKTEIEKNTKLYDDTL